MIIPENMRRCKAAILESQHAPLLIEEIDLPEQLAWGQVLVRLKFSGICGSQIGEIDGVKGEDRFLPHLLGHEGSGAVMAAGPGISRVAVGDHVVLHWRKSLGHEAPPPVYAWRKGRLNAGYVTTFNEYAIVSENRLTVIPKDLPLDVAALFGCAVTTGLGVVVNNARLKIGESIAVFGAGGVGLSIVLGASMASAYPIIAIDRFDNRLDLARQMGATHTINAAREDTQAAVGRIVGSRGADVTVDNTGNTAVIALAYAMTQPAGRTVLVGVPRIGDNISIHSLPLHFEKQLTGSHGGEAVPHEDIPRYVRLYRNGRLALDEMISDVFLLADINAAIENMRNGAIAGRGLIQFF